MKPKLAGRGIQLGIPECLRVDHDTYSGYHRRQNSTDCAHMIDIDTACLRKTRICAGGCHSDTDFGTREKPHQETAQEEEQQTACRNLNAEQFEGEQIVK